MGSNQNGHSTITDYKDISGDPHAIPANRISDERDDRVVAHNPRKAVLLTQVGALLAVITALPAEDFPGLYLTADDREWTVQVCQFDNGTEADRRAIVDRIAALAGLPAATDRRRSYSARDGSGNSVFTAIVKDAGAVEPS